MSATTAQAPQMHATVLAACSGFRWRYEDYPTTQLRACLLRDQERRVAGRMLLQFIPEGCILRSIFVAPELRYSPHDPEPRHLGNQMLQALLDAHGDRPIWLRPEPDLLDPGLSTEGLIRWYTSWGWLPASPPPRSLAATGWMCRDPLGLPAVGDPRHRPQVEEVAQRWEQWNAQLRVEPLRVLHAHEYEERAICLTYGFAIPTREAITALAAAGPLVEVGAGLGWWARLITAAGGSVVPTDKRPPRPAWSEVEPLADAAAVATYPDRTLLLIWPESWSTMASRALRAYQGDQLWFVGELPGDVSGRAPDMGDAAFLRRLAREWSLTATITLPWRTGFKDALYRFERRRVSSR